MKMRIISDSDICKLSISPLQWVEWVRDVFLMKRRCQLPPKVSLHPQGSDFINTMPCMLPEEYHMFGCKVVSRIKGGFPALKSEMMLMDSATGDMLALVNCERITAMRTGAVAALAVQTLKSSKAKIYSFVGLGVVGHATLDCLLPVLAPGSVVRLKRYKRHAEEVIEQYSSIYPELNFEVSDSIEELITDADVIVSCITDAEGYFTENTDLFKPGVLIVPVHTRGFQNCDTVFDKIFADDEGHVKGFQYFSQFRRFGELGDVLTGAIKGRENDEERILSYNIGIGLHDLYFAYKMLNLPQ